MFLGLWKTGIQPDMKHSVWEESLNPSWTSCGRRQSLKVKIWFWSLTDGWSVCWVVIRRTGTYRYHERSASRCIANRLFINSYTLTHTHTHTQTANIRIRDTAPATSPSPSQLILITSWTLPVICPLDSVTQWPRNHLIPSKPPPCVCFQDQHVSQAQCAGGGGAGAGGGFALGWWKTGRNWKTLWVSLCHNWKSRHKSCCSSYLNY